MSTTPPAYGQQQAQAYTPSPAYPHTKPLPTNTTVADTNTYALVAIVLTFIVPIAGIIFGHLGLGQIKRTGDAGRGLALTAVIYGYTITSLGILFFIFYIGFFFVMFGTLASTF